MELNLHLLQQAQPHHAQTALNVQELTESQDVPEDPEEVATEEAPLIDGENEDDVGLQALEADTVTDQEVVIEVGQEEPGEERQEQLHQDGGQPLRPE